MGLESWKVLYSCSVEDTGDVPERSRPVMRATVILLQIHTLQIKNLAVSDSDSVVRTM